MLTNVLNIYKKRDFKINNLGTLLNGDNKILGEAHTKLVQTYTREILFKKIKIVSHNHLEMNGVIMRNVFEKLKFSENMHGNDLVALAHACRTEIRNTISSRRGYVKRKIGMQIAGKLK